jgi:GxxExxY protein
MINAEAGRRGGAEMAENLLSEQILDAAIEVHRTLGGPGLLESLYEEALFYELRLRNIPALSQVPIPVTYKNLTLRKMLGIWTEAKALAIDISFGTQY